MESVTDGNNVTKLIESSTKEKSLDDSSVQQHQTLRSTLTFNKRHSTNKTSLVYDPNVYKFTRKKMGYVVMIINSKFDTSPRPFAEEDSCNMTELFKKLGFEPKIIEDKSKTELRISLREISDSIDKNHDCLVCVISSHGAEIPVSRPNQPDSKLSQHVIYTRDEFIPTTEILSYFDDNNCENLIGKPKMFFIQACRCKQGADERFDVDPGADVEVKHEKKSSPYNSNKTYSDGETIDKLNRVNLTLPDTQGHPGTECTSNYSDSVSVDTGDTFEIPCEEDYLVMFTTSSGRLGWSDAGTGGWLMGCLYKVFDNLLKTNYQMDLLQILTHVCSEMAHELESNCPSQAIYHRTKSAAVIYHRLTKDLYLKPKFYRMVEKRDEITDTKI